MVRQEVYGCLARGESLDYRVFGTDRWQKADESDILRELSRDDSEDIDFIRLHIPFISCSVIINPPLTKVNDGQVIYYWDTEQSRPFRIDPTDAGYAERKRNPQDFLLYDSHANCMYAWNQLTKAIHKK